MSEITKETPGDLGDDLLATKTIPFDREKPKPSGSAKAEGASATAESVDELLLNSKILLREGLLEDAKKTLRRVLRLDPGNRSASERLEEIQKLEIKRMLGPEENSSGGGFLRPKRKREDPALEDGDAVRIALERELGAVAGVEADFYAKAGSREDFFATLDRLSTGASAQDCIDLGIGFLEMEFFEAAIRLFGRVVRQDPEDRRARALLATAWIAKGDGFEAMIEIEALVADQDAPPGEKVDYGYLAGRAQELLLNFPLAVRWYRAVLQIEPHYRDADDRLRQSLKRLSS